MPDWNDLSKDTKRKVVEKLDLMSRISLKSTCRLNREIVYSTELFVPRVRFFRSDKKCLLMIYTGIEKFLRLEFISTFEGILMKKYENNYKDCNSKLFLSSFPPSEFGTQILYNLFGDKKSITLGTIEWQVDSAFSVAIDLQHAKTGIIEPVEPENLDKVCKFYAQKCVINTGKAGCTEYDLAMDVFCDKKTLKRLETNVLNFDGDFMEPGYVIDMRSAVTTGKWPWYYSTTSMGTPDDESFHSLCSLTELFDTSLSTMRYSEKEDSVAHFDSWNHPIQRTNSKVITKRTMNKDDMILRYNKSECGFWIHAVAKKNEKKFLLFFKNESCGLGWLCKKCTVPFDYWFYNHSLPRRIHNEAEWVSVIGNQDKMEELKQKYAYEEKYMEQDYAKSWGFKTSKTGKEGSGDSSEDVGSWSVIFNDFYEVVRSVCA